MSIRAKVTAVAVTAAACVLLAPAAMAATHSPVQVTGKQLKSALLPASDFVAGYKTTAEGDSGRTLEHLLLNNVPSMSCKDFWATAGMVFGFGETAFAGDLVADKTGMLSPHELFNQGVYQFASTRAAASFFAKITTKYRSCRSLTESDGSGGTLRETVHSATKQRVGGHQALQIIQFITDSKVSGPAVPVYLLWTINGTDVYFINTTLLDSSSPQPTQSSLTLKLIARVTALR